MRVPIREQLGALVLTSVLVALAVVTIATWITNHNFILNIRSSRLTLTASLKASQVASNLALMRYTVSSFSTRVKIQAALVGYDSGNTSQNLLRPAQQDLEAALGREENASLTLQAIIYPNTGISGGILNATGVGLSGTLKLPYSYPNGTPVELGDPGLGYPSNLYPNFTFTGAGKGSNGQPLPHFHGEALHAGSSILLGPWQINETFALVSITLPILSNASKARDILGWMTVLYNTNLITSVVDSHVGLDKTGISLLVTPTAVDNRFRGTSAPPYLGRASEVGEQRAHFAFPPRQSKLRHKRHSEYHSRPSFELSAYPAALTALTSNQHSVDNAGSLISTKDEQNYKVSVGYALVPSDLCNWVFIIEESVAEVWAPINHLRYILLGCVFGTAGLMLVLVFPIAHFSSLPIRRLRQATKNSIEPPSSTAPGRLIHTGSIQQAGGIRSPASDPLPNSVSATAGAPILEKPLPLVTENAQNFERHEVDDEYLTHKFNIPGKVKDGKHWIHDELTDLTKTFNAMSDELVFQYSRLEERVMERTAQLEESKKAAEAANESKTLFIANISHELKTPLNGILGMSAVALQEEDPARIKHSLSIIMKSGDLLHLYLRLQPDNLLTDLLTFSKNEIGQHLSLEEKEFRLRDVGSQVRAIFDKQARESQVTFSIDYEGGFDVVGSQDGTVEKTYGPPGTGRVKDMHLWGDQHRILQVVINLVGNSLKFTPKGGSVALRIRCVGDVPPRPLARYGSTESKPPKKRPIHRLQRLARGRGDADSATSTESKAEVEEISALEQLKPPSHTTIASDSEEVPHDARELVFEFEVGDTGPGIPEHLRAQIFEPFVQGDLRLTKKFGGTGLGLSICQQLAKLMSGSIKLESEVDAGSTFALHVPLKLLQTRRGSATTSTFTISRANSVSGHADTRSAGELSPTDSPDAEESSQGKAANFEGDSKPRLVGLSQPFFSTSKPPMSSPSSKRERMRVLVAEDNKVNQEVVLHMLRLEEVFDVTVARDGQEALDLVKDSMLAQSPYDLVLMDIQMPRLDGRQSTRKIRDIGFNAPIVALTAFSDESNQKACLESGMDYFLSKPIRRPALKHVLKTYCPPIQELDEAEPKSSVNPPSTVHAQNGKGSATDASVTGTSQETG